MYSLTKDNLVEPYLSTNQHQSGVTLWFHFLVSLSINNNRETDKSRPDGDKTALTMIWQSILQVEGGYYYFELSHLKS